MNSVSESLEKLDLYLDQSGFAGYDPYDLKQMRWVVRLIRASQGNKLLQILREAVFELFNHFPMTFRVLFRVKKTMNAKAMGLISKAYLDIYLFTNRDEYLRKSQEGLKFLKENSVACGGGIGWGYPFDWQSSEFIPRFTPNGIVTTAVTDAFWTWYQYSGEQQYLEICIEACNFLVALPIDYLDDDKICFSYTPLYKNHVHNLNLFIAEFLIKIGKETGRDDWTGLGLKALNYTLAAQLDNGAFDYNGPPEKPLNFIDHYHTGFVLRMLLSIYRMTDRQDIFDTIEKCYRHYLKNFFEDKTIPKLKPENKYRIDIHSCSEAIICLCELKEYFPDAEEVCVNVVKWTIANMQGRNGSFYYAKLKSRFIGIVYTSKISYIRWGQAWMLKALSTYEKLEKQ